MRRHAPTEAEAWVGMRAFLTARRKGLGIAQVELARRLGVTRYLVGRWERGDHIPGATNFIAWAAELGLFVEVTDAEPQAER